MPKHKPKKDVLVIFGALFLIIILYGFTVFKIVQIQFQPVKLFVSLVILCQFAMFTIEYLVWKNCAESIYVRAFGQLGFLFSYLWSRMLINTTHSDLDQQLVRYLKYSESIILASYMFRILKYVAMLGKIHINQ
ncbi:Hypothetical_protein [Hexamita inflata]|uniref:Hypothetical_protein n=1 Tax=Hexamita inflata TaxID=28002 RepID=A0AA86TPP9_9EUKA|nr:Hypothetical protein HINF_LOCUS12614 [Hexamita inflata]